MVTVGVVVPALELLNLLIKMIIDVRCKIVVRIKQCWSKYLISLQE